MAIKNSYKLLIIVITVLFLLLIWNNAHKSEAKDQKVGDVTKNESEIVNVTKSFDYATSGNIEGLVNFSDFIVSGHYEKLERQWDMGGGYMSDLYTFVIDNSLLGGLEENISVAIPQYVTVQTDIGGKSYSSNLDLPNKTTPNKNSKYILFLKKYEPANVYTPASVPFQIEMNSTGQTVLTYNKSNTLKEVKTDQNQTIHFNLDNLNEGLLDEISGLSENEITTKIMESAKNR